MPSPGTKLTLTNGVWTIAGPLKGASGGFGDLYIVHDPHGDEAIAKLVKKDPGADRELLIGAATSAAAYSNVVPVLDHGEHDTSWVLVMPRADTNLADYVSKNGPLDVDQVLVILRDVATALSAINNDLVHRDIKPQNILLLAGEWCLADFGISRYAAATTSPDTRKYSLTPQYAAPEQWKAERCTAAADVYSFGVVGYELLAGHLPFPGPDIAEFRDQHVHQSPPDLAVGPVRLRDLIDECLYKPPGARPTPTAILRRLDKAADRPAAAGLEKLAQAQRAVVQEQSDVHAKVSAEQEQRESREELHATAVKVFTRIAKELVEQIQDNAPAANVTIGSAPRNSMRRNVGKEFIATLNGADLGVDQPALSPAKWRVPFTVISESVITVTRPHAASDGWAGRSHSLWYCDAHEEGRFAWHELAFWQFNAHPAIEPTAAAAQQMQIVFQPVMHTIQLAWPPTELERFDLS